MSLLYPINPATPGGAISQDFQASIGLPVSIVGSGPGPGPSGTASTITNGSEYVTCGANSTITLGSGGASNQEISMKYGGVESVTIAATDSLTLKTNEPDAYMIFNTSRGGMSIGASPTSTQGLFIGTNELTFNGSTITLGSAATFETINGVNFTALVSTVNGLAA